MTWRSFFLSYAAKGLLFVDVFNVGDLGYPRSALGQFPRIRPGPS